VQSQHNPVSKKSSSVLNESVPWWTTLYNEVGDTNLAIIMRIKNPRADSNCKPWYAEFTIPVCHESQAAMNSINLIRIQSIVHPGYGQSERRIPLELRANRYNRRPAWSLSTTNGSPRNALEAHGQAESKTSMRLPSLGEKKVSGMRTKGSYPSGRLQEKM
jgi:hypothetical protein